jgi:precorrin-4/cobalt-precorrin-4 C11-methyltransferase
MKVYFVGAGPGDADLLTVKAHRLLTGGRCCIYAGSLVNPDLLRLLPAGAERHDSAGMDLEGILAVIRGAQTRDVDVIRLHTGEPAIYGAIGEQMDALDRLGIEYEIVPGISSFQAAAAALKTELTAPNVAQTVILTRTAGRTPMPPREDLARLAQSGATLCVFLSSDRAEQIAATLLPHYGPDCPAAAVYHASWPDQKIVRGTLTNIAELMAREKITRTAIVIVGHAMTRPLSEASRLYDSTFTHGYRKGAQP